MASNLLNKIVEVEVEGNDLENNSGSSFIKEGGVYKVTVDKAFISQTKKGGLQVDLIFAGDNIWQETLYIASMKNKKLTTTCKMGGKTVSLPSFKLFKQIMFLATNEPVDISTIETVEETIKYKAYGKDVEVDGETITALIGKEFTIAVRAEEEYNYEDGEVDKTSLKVDSDGNTRYKLSLYDVYNEDGLNAIEVVQEAEEPKAMIKTEEFLKSDKGIRRVVLELPEMEEDEIEDENDELEF